MSLHNLKCFVQNQARQVSSVSIYSFAMSQSKLSTFCLLFCGQVWIARYGVVEFALPAYFPLRLKRFFTLYYFIGFLRCYASVWFSSLLILASPSFSYLLYHPKSFSATRNLLLIFSRRTIFFFASREQIPLVENGH